MYSSSFMDLGRFYVPSYAQDDWVPNVRYLPEPPKPIRGAMNPWQQERQRVLWMAEERAWKDIVTLQVEWRSLFARLNRLMTRYNQLVGEIENLMGPSSLQKMAGPMKMIPLPGPALFSLFADLFSGLFGRGKKKQAEGKIRELEAVQAEMVTIQTRLEAINTRMQQLVGTAETVHSQQVVQVSMDIEHSELLYSRKQATERAQAQAHKALVRQAQLVRQAGGRSDVL